MKYLALFSFISGDCTKFWASVLRPGQTESLRLTH
jgi:hypothetical protein